jgi:hypothetical protein
MLEKVLYEDGDEIQKCVNIFEKRNLRTPGNTSELFRKYFYLEDIKVEPWFCNTFLSVENCTEDVDLAKKNSLSLGQKTYYSWTITKKLWRILAFHQRSFSSHSKASYGNFNSISNNIRRSLTNRHFQHL